MLRTMLQAAARSDRLERMVGRNRLLRPAVDRFVAGATADDVIRAARRLADEGRYATIDQLGEACRDARAAEETARQYVALLGKVADAGLADHVEVSVKLSALGSELDWGVAEEQTRLICAAAEEAGTTVTVDMEDSSTTDDTLRVLRALREDYPRTGGVLQAMLHRTEGDCRAFAEPGSRIRLCKGAYHEPAAVARTNGADVNDAYLRCLGVLMEGGAYPMVATHDPRLVAGAAALARKHGLGRDDWEFQMLFGVRTDEQRRLANAGHRVRVYLPYGPDWYRYTCRRLAERPANLVLLGRAMLSRS
ncbi:L-proline dehydrogenase [Streptoalloteichus tenebrarius]|uniref:proline dehydrogenase n=1 Tax=Streptoalloteichus tenebrarius (strain ATCC 17920 / DSM 40477 / JCM 4838 / CBS 697.72 / NBRC 16177 / NCIMB 11028 / NRRL B-12390 / A12253. 1 / ISP 5477) TaxID=1933 RepID=A0ABT1HS00_STRSD|nr:proline dehydrogenase family protein [Streptoalloteichus tenebrarius]MCP2258294.1 L-proline dehydrogenase [Streptoalloteichus tenebrarius]BFF04472.1 proline dehydrogenase family protein [Streptoalloteichus tenebrarius]